MSRHLWVVAAVMLALTVAACEEETPSGESQSQTGQTEAPAVAPGAGGQAPAATEPATEETMGEQPAGDTSMDEEPGSEGMPGTDEDTAPSQNQ